MRVMPCFSALLAAVVALICLPAPAYTAGGEDALGGRTVIQLHDDRVTASTEPGQANAAVGQVYAPRLGAAGTGFLLGHCHMLTNRHVVMDENGVARDRKLRITLAGAELEGSVIANGRSHELSDDWALLKLDPCADPAITPVALDMTDPRTVIDSTLPLEVAGYPHDHDDGQLWLDPWCRPQGLYRDGLLTHDCTLGSGNSGGPVTLKRGSTPTQLGVIGLNVAVVSPQDDEVKERVSLKDPFRVALAIPVASLVDELGKHVPDLALQGSKPADWPPADLGRHGLMARHSRNIVHMARQGNPQAMMEVCIDPAKYSLHNPKERGRHCRSLAHRIAPEAEAGDAERQLIMGWLMQTGLGGQVDKPAAVEWYRRAARQGDEVALYNLGLAYLNGEGIAPNRRSAITLLRASADKGYDPAIDLLNRTLGTKPDR